MKVIPPVPTISVSGVGEGTVVVTETVSVTVMVSIIVSGSTEQEINKLPKAKSVNTRFVFFIFYDFYLIQT